MYKPTNFESIIASKFYDKTVTKLTTTYTTDAEGCIVASGTGDGTTFKGNVQYNNCKLVAEEYGLDYQVDVTITTGTDTVIDKGDTISYDGIIYRVMDKIVSDTHILLVGVKNV